MRADTRASTLLCLFRPAIVRMLLTIEIGAQPPFVKSAPPEDNDVDTRNPAPPIAVSTWPVFWPAHAASCSAPAMRAAAAADADVRPHHQDHRKWRQRTARARSRPNSMSIPTSWFFKCHFQDDPVMPGCLGLDALWQMVGFFLGWARRPRQGPRARRRRSEIHRHGSADRQEGQLLRRSEARDHAQARAGRRRRHRQGRRQARLRSEGSESRPVHRRSGAADGGLRAPGTVPCKLSCPTHATSRP